MRTGRVPWSVLACEGRPAARDLERSNVELRCRSVTRIDTIRDMMLDDMPDVTPAPAPATLRLGTQGWNYATWIGPFYPDGTRAPDFLRTYARAFNTVEVDSTFYAIPAASTVRGWAARTPESFTFAVKLPQEITHERRFIDAHDVLHAFVDRMRELGPRLGPVLIQCGPDFSPLERNALQHFLAELPEAPRFAIEFRQRAWISQETLAMLRVTSRACAKRRSLDSTRVVAQTLPASDDRLQLPALDGTRSHYHRLFAFAG